MNILQLKQEGFFVRFYKLAFVNILSNIMVPLAGLVDVAFLGHLTEIYDLAGVAVAAVIFNYLYRLLNFLRMGTTGVTAQAVGADDRETVLLVCLRNGFIALVLGSAILIFQYPMEKLWFDLLSASPEVKTAGAAYFNARIWGAPAVAINLVIIGWLLGLEKSTQVLWMTALGNGANMLLDYFFIVRWGWGSWGAGLSTCLSQYLTLLIGIIWISRQIKFQEIFSVAERFWNWLEFKATFILNGDIFIRILANRGTLLLFTNLGAAIGTNILAGNALMIEVILLTISFIEGIGFATETLSGNFRGKGEFQKLTSLVAIAVANSVFIGLSFALVFLLFPEALFGLLTNHAEVTDEIKIYIPWLVPVLGFLSVAFMLDGYFLGLSDGSAPRNSALSGFFLGFTPIAIWAWYVSSNQILWLSLAAFMLVRALTISLQLPRSLQFNNDNE
ncbi:guanitoxin biosynthesis MATE family efflux transporter GntT [Roseofilum sp. BLCC_M154]|uniref:Guanitoxin biosynthesis MATE family efflux transporter GntT n=1 Tax=Roseofilum acuticapitatum BLCC-M154 TaxID=3022444 RepID=A0ABT7AYN1_9CYAN|nr:guanitoxin biosynthesis MATE family efflux transporter GntT [Roseofilum acuticapitatum]MDJ1171697.1 guanitoxin biosynthesis MATE family efflux transporter GntT [Roseofilum acuticapitatum BLCC-M154]